MYLPLHSVLAGGLAFLLLSSVTARSTPRHPSRAQVQLPSHQSSLGEEQEIPEQPLQDVLGALEVMQDTYFDMYGGTWSNAIDWTAAVTGTYVSATLSGIVEGLNLMFTSSCSVVLGWENIVNKYYTQIAFFYFGENVFALRNQAFDDMLWVVLGWLESVKFAEMYNARHSESDASDSDSWHGTQLSPMAAHRSRIFYEIASVGWDEALCDGGMTWNPTLTPYKNAITNELFTAASISMYLFFPGDNNSAPFVSGRDGPKFGAPHDPVYLENAIKSYKWLKESHMRNAAGLYQDGFHISGWHRYSNGTINPGTGKCDELNTMVYTYNQGVLLTANRGLWIATGARSYLDDGHDLVSSVIRATGWPNYEDREWQGLGRRGVLEEFCDHNLYCSQDGQTFKGIFFHHLTEFCRPLRKAEKNFLISHADTTAAGVDDEVYEYHLQRCAAYKKWVFHNAEAALRTKNQDGLFGMWWGAPMRRHSDEWRELEQQLPDGAMDHLNPSRDLRLHEQANTNDLNDRGRGRTVETQGGALAVLRARWQWHSSYS